MTAAKPDAQLSPGSNEPVAQPPMAWLTPGLTRAILIIAGLASIDGAAITFALVLKLPAQAALLAITNVSLLIIGAALHGAGTKQGADAAGK